MFQAFSCLALYLGFCVQLCQAQEMQPMIKMPETPSREYRVESQYGPNVSILNPLFPRVNKISLGIGGSYSSLSSLHSTYAFNGSLMYHFNHRHAIEPLYFSYQKSSMSGFVESQIRDENVSEGNAALNDTLTVSLPKYVYAASYFFTPYYSKMHIGYNTVAHFDFFFGAGIAYIKQEQVSLNGNLIEETGSIGASLSAGMRFLFRPRFGLRFELRDFIYKAEDIGDTDMVNNLQMAMSFDIFFGSFPKRN